MTPRSRRRKLIKLIIILSAIALALVDQDIDDSPQETLMWQLAAAKIAMDQFDENEENWSYEQNSLAGLVDVIYACHEPEAITAPTEQTYATWSEDLGDLLSQLNG